VDTEPPAGNLIILKGNGGNSGRFAHTIYQEDLEELILRRNEAREACKQLREKEKFVSAALRGGARIEPGVHEAEFVPVSREGYSVSAGVHFRLAVR